MSHADKLLEQFPATKKLKSLGITQDELNAAQFIEKHWAAALDERPITWAPNMPINRDPGTLSYLRDYLIYKSVLEGATAGTSGLSEFWLHTTMALAAPMIGARLSHINSNKKNAEEPRGYVPELQGRPKEFIFLVCRRPEYREMNARQMWPHFLSALSERGLGVKDHGSFCEYEYKESTKTISFRTFANYVRDARNEVSRLRR